MNKLLILALVGLASCYTVKDAVKQTHKAKDNYPDTIAAVLRAWKPCIVTYKDTVTNTDTLVDIIAVECPGDTLWRTDTLETSYTISLPKIIKVPLPRIRETRTVTIRIKDSADTQVLEGRLRVKDKQLKSAGVWINTWLIVAIIGWALFIIVLLIKRR